MLEVQVGHKVSCSIAYLDADGKPMTVTPDAPPAWSQTTPATETLAIAADGSTCVATAVAAGNDTINMSVTVGGNSFSASLAVQAAAQVLSSVEIVPVVA